MRQFPRLDRRSEEHKGTDMFAKANHPFLIGLKARMAIAVAIEVLVVIALLLHNSEMVWKVHLN